MVAVGPVEQPGAVGVPGSHGSEVGCEVGSTNAGGDWEPACDEIQLALDPTDQIWKATLDRLEAIIGQAGADAGGHVLLADIDELRRSVLREQAESKQWRRWHVEQRPFRRVEPRSRARRARRVRSGASSQALHGGRTGR